MRPCSLSSASLPGRSRQRMALRQRATSGSRRMATDCSAGSAIGGSTKPTSMRPSTRSRTWASVVASRRVRFTSGDSLAKLSQNDRQHVVIRDADETDRQFADLAATGAPGHLHRLLDARQDLACFLQKDLPGLGQRHMPLGAMEQHHAQFFLERTNLHRQGRLRNMQFLRGPPEVKFLGHGYEIAQVAQFHLIRNTYQKSSNNILDTCGRARPNLRPSSVPMAGICGPGVAIRKPHVTVAGERTWQTTGAVN